MKIIKTRKTNKIFHTMQIKVIPNSRNTDILFSRTLDVDFDEVLKEALNDMRLRIKPSFLKDSDFTADYRLHSRLMKKQAMDLEERLYDAAGIDYEPYREKKVANHKTSTFHGTLKRETGTICGFTGNLLFGDLEYLHC